MKMKLFAAAVAALAAGGAYAQSSVTLYGVADVGLEYNTNANAAGDDLFRMASGNQSGSRWGLRGVEDLGGGLKGVFVLESGFDLDNGTSAQGGRLFGRQAYVGVQSQYGSLLLGRQQTSFYDFGLIYDPMAISSRYGILAQDSQFAARADNTVKYIGTFGGLTANAFYSFNNNGQETAGAFRRGQQYGALLNYAAGPFSVGAAYDEIHGTSTGTGAALVDQSGQRTRRATVGANYAFGPAKVYAGYRWAKAFDGAALTGGTTVDNGVVTTSTSSNLYWLGLGYQLTPAFSLSGAAYYQDFRKSDADPWQFVITADYALSKRTDVYTSLSYALNDKGSALGVNGFNTATTTNVQPNKDQFGAVVGLRHKF
ncbi:porin [Cupriavidus consociatus]|uniref:porin n=1 Tax=Cupriavidus consociatus TaxID=2821357 RepID=UPI001AEA2F9A|nr:MULTISPECIES: porin [unclassified Cupriavidus]MBP0622560.1 porin [Cupriavidus sp. LEh25]MDK2659245.1 porin [Cupriavidus sp. LEh21]